MDLKGRATRNFRQAHKDGACYPNSAGYCDCPLEDAEPEVADLVCSDVELPLLQGMHFPVIDLDLPCQLIPSGTPGHFHLYLDKPVPWEQYKNIIKALCEAGLVQWAWFDTTRERGYSSVRHPDRPKEITNG